MYVVGSLSKSLNREILALFINETVTYNEELYIMHDHFHVFFVSIV